MNLFPPSKLYSFLLLLTSICLLNISIFPHPELIISAIYNLPTHQWVHFGRPGTKTATPQALPAELGWSIHLFSHHHSNSILGRKHSGVAGAKGKLHHSVVRWKIIVQGKDWSSGLDAVPSLCRQIPCSPSKRLNRGGFGSHSVTKDARFGVGKKNQSHNLKVS